MNFGKSVIKPSFISKNTNNSAWGRKHDFHCEINKVDGVDITYVLLVHLRRRRRGNQLFPESIFLMPIEISPFCPF